MADAGARFPMGWITRGGIAADLNTALGRTEFTPDDDRLSDDICRHYAREVGEDPDMEHGIAEDVAEMALESKAKA